MLQTPKHICHARRVLQERMEQQAKEKSDRAWRIQAIAHIQAIPDTVLPARIGIPVKINTVELSLSVQCTSDGLRMVQDMANPIVTLYVGMDSLTNSLTYKLNIAGENMIENINFDTVLNALVTWLINHASDNWIKAFIAMHEDSIQEKPGPGF